MPPSPRPSQANPVWQFPPPQHACPEPPQLLLQVPPKKPPSGRSHAKPELQALPVQHGSPDPPHSSHTNPASAPTTQPREPVHWPEQQACPDCPQAVQVPAEQLAPVAVQYVCAPTAASAVIPQQAWPTAPQGVPPVLEQLPLEQVPETPVPVQASPAATQVRAPIVPGMQHPPPLQLLPAQQV